MKTLSVLNPWAHAIIHLGKDVENRTWKTNYRGPLLIHAGKAVSRNGYLICQEREPKTLPMEFEPYGTGYRPVFIHPDYRFGGIIGVVDLVDCVQGSTSKWAEWWTGDGVYQWVLANPRPLPFLPLRGRLGLFEAEHPEL